MAALVKYAVSMVGDNPDPPFSVEGGFGGVGERFPNDGRRGRSEETFAAPPKPARVNLKQRQAEACPTVVSGNPAPALQCGIS